MRKLIHSSFELDLSQFKISDTEENSWFSDSFFTKYSFPFEIDLEKDIDIALGFISVYNSSAIDTYLDLKYVYGDKIEEAIFEVESYQNKLSCILRFGFEQLPSFDKKLTELSLYKSDLPTGTTIYQHAEATITKVWPDVNYKFQQIHTDKYDPEDELYTGFEKIINNRKNGAFLINSVDPLTDVAYNRNIMQPLPYWLHILQRGMLDAGYNLSGDILTDDRIKKALLFGDVDYYGKDSTQADISIVKYMQDAITTQYARQIESVTTLPTPGKYNISGTITLKRQYGIFEYYEIRYNNIVLNKKANSVFSYGQETYEIDIDFETKVGSTAHVVTIVAAAENLMDEPVLQLTISCTRTYDSSGFPIPSINNLNQIDLTKSVPDITFGDFVKVVKNWFNYDLIIQGNLAVMDRIEDQINYNNAVDLSDYEVKYPLRKFSKGNSFLLKFEDVDSKDYKYDVVFHSSDAIVNKGYKVDDKTTTIEINALPLPLLTRDGVQTAHAFINDNSKVFLVVDSTDTAINNYSLAPNEYYIPQIHERYWKAWFNTRLFSQEFRWNFSAWEEKINTISTKSKLFAYNRYHIIKSINRTEIKPELYEVEIEIVTLP